MTQTRGRPTQALARGDGSIRHVADKHIAAALVAGGYTGDADLTGVLLHLFGHRIALVDAAAPSLRDERKKLVRIQKAAQEPLH